MIFRLLKLTTKDDVIVPATTRQYTSIDEAIKTEMDDEEIESLTLEDEEGYFHTVIRNRK